MTLATIIQDRTRDGVTIVDFLFAVMRNELAGFKPCHRLDAAKLLVKYQLDDALDFLLNTPPEQSRPRTGSGSPEDTYFDTKLAKVIRESTDDGRSVCRFLINVMEGELKAFRPHHQMDAARELLSRGFGKQAREAAARPTNRPPLPQGEGWGEGENHEDQPDPEEEQRWAEINEIIDSAIEESDRIMAEQGIDPDNPPYVPDLSAFNQAWENSQRWFEEWKNSIDPEEYEAVVNETAARFDAKLDARIERRKQIAADRERRAKEEAEREAEQAKARAEAKATAESAAAEEPADPGPPPAREEHESWSPTPNIPTSFRLRNCGHPKCKLHDGPIYYPEDDRNSRYYFDGRAPPMYGSYGL